MARRMGPEALQVCYTVLQQNEYNRTRPGVARNSRADGRSEIPLPLSRETKEDRWSFTNGRNNAFEDGNRLVFEALSTW